MNLVINSAYKCTLNVFIDGLIRQDFSGLVLEGKPSIDEQQNGFNAILAEYIGIVKGDERQSETRTLQQLMIRQAKLAELMFVFAQMDGASTPYIQQFQKSILQKYYGGALIYARIENDVKTLQFDINNLRKQLAANNNGEPVTDKTFEKTLAVLSEHNKHFIKSNEITVARYALLLKQYETDIKSENARKGVNNNYKKQPKR